MQSKILNVCTSQNTFLCQYIFESFWHINNCFVLTFEVFWIKNICHPKSSKFIHQVSVN